MDKRNVTQRGARRMPYTLAQAAKAIGRDKTTILRAIRRGKISAIRDEATGTWIVEPAELHRIYPAVADAAPAADNAAERSGDAAERSGGAAGETVVLRTQLDQERVERLRERADKDAVIDDLRRRLDAAEEERRTTLRQLTALLPPAQPAPVSVRRPWWQIWQRAQPTPGGIVRG